MISDTKNVLDKDVKILYLFIKNQSLQEIISVQKSKLDRLIKENEGRQRQIEEMLQAQNNQTVSFFNNTWRPENHV